MTKIYYFYLFIILNLLKLISSDDVTFRAKEVDTLVVFTLDSHTTHDDKTIAGLIEYFYNFVSLWKGHFGVDYSNLPVQLFFGKYNATNLLQAADAENNTAAMIVLQNNDEFIINITAEAVNYEPPPVKGCVKDVDDPSNPALCNQMIHFLKTEKYHTKLTKLNFLVLSNACPHADTFNQFKSYVENQITTASDITNVKVTSSYLVTTWESACNLTYEDNNVIVIRPDKTHYSKVDNATVNAFLDPRFSPRQFTAPINFFNLFIAVSEDNYNTTIEFITNYIFNSSICGIKTQYKSSAFAYYILMRVKYLNEHKLANYKEITTMVPWIDFEAEKIDFSEYLKQNLDYQLSLKEAVPQSSQQSIQQQLTNIYIAGSLRTTVSANNNTQFNLFFADEIPPWLTNGLFYTHQEGRILDFVLYAPDIDEKTYDKYLTQFYNETYKNHPAINMVIINSTDPEELPYVPICKETVERAFFPYRHLSPPLQWYIWVIIGVGVLAIIIIAANVLYWRFLRPKDPIDMIAQNFKLNEEEKKLFSNARDKLFIDEAMVEVDYNVILGRGASSTVYKAIIKGIAPSLRPKKELESAVSEDYIVAAKVSNQFGREQIEELIGEIEAARCLENHPNICAMLGWSTHLGAPCLLFESMELDLLSYIKSLRVESNDVTSVADSVSLTSIANSEHYSVPDFDENQQKIFLQILWQASKGLEYIASKNIVHRDVAARNFLLSRNGNTFTAKIADFGLCSNVDENTNVYRSSLNKRLPIKWLAIESLVDRTFSQASDVWAFGVTMIEMYSCANELYPGIGLNEVTDYLKNGNRMERPEKMPQEMYDVASSCWKEDPSSRPTFLDLRDQFETILRGMGGVDIGYLGLNENDQEEIDNKSIAF